MPGGRAASRSSSRPTRSCGPTPRPRPLPALSHLFQAYNRVLWEQFPYCRQCLGGCCVLDATFVGPFDALALALLGERVPALPARIPATERDCIYHLAEGCAWSPWWRPIKCWSFYCLGRAREQLPDALGERRAALTEALAGVILDLLPEPLRRYEAATGDRLVAHLGDPVELAGAFGAALAGVVAAPFAARYPLPHRAPAAGRHGGALPDGFLPDEDLLALVAEVAEQAGESLPLPLAGLAVSAGQLLADLELLEWVTEGHPTQGAKLLDEMYCRYAAAPAPRQGESPTIGYRMRSHILRLRRQWAGH